MPIYEFYCADCHRIYNFFSRGIRPDARPTCPRCGKTELSRKPSSFAVSRNRPEPGEGEGQEPDVDESRLERAMDSLAGELDGVDESDPRQAARVMRRLFEATGMPIGGGMEEALRRMEAGEDPEKVEEQLGDALDDDPFEAGTKEGAGKKKVSTLARRLLPPTVDPNLYELDS